MSQTPPEFESVKALMHILHHFKRLPCLPVLLSEYRTKIILQWGGNTVRADYFCLYFCGVTHEKTGGGGHSHGCQMEKT